MDSCNNDDLSFKVIDMTIGLRVSEEEEIVGLDSKEHGLASCICRIQHHGYYRSVTMNENENTDLGVGRLCTQHLQSQRAAAVQGSQDR